MNLTTEAKEIVEGGGYVGFALAKLEKAIWKSDREVDMLVACPYKWTIFHRNGTVEVNEGKINEFWNLLGIPARQGRGIKRGPVGYINRPGTGFWDWEPVENEVEWKLLHDSWTGVVSSEQWKALERACE